ncbi:rhodanese-like domain-containing protein [Ferrimonas senticii]|uniref:rhodanese-like domain-containing protein n=1 Tax=Ferrimonas senticii TaxID=394566 RepID=UPI000424EE5F|nr:rhodanese-like domain-containing protein [Ferrimonas senticii]
MKQWIAVAAMLLSTQAMAYDKELAASYQDYFAPVHGAAVGKALGLTTPDAYLKKAKAGEVVTLDVRNPGELSAVQIGLPNTLAIPANEVFKPENLAKLPTDKTIAVMCKTGGRATAVGTALRHIGFDNVVIVKKGIDGVAVAVTPAF